MAKHKRVSKKKAPRTVSKKPAPRTAAQACAGCASWHAPRRQCRVHAPAAFALTAVQRGTMKGTWPTTAADDWCSEWTAAVR